MSQFHSTKYLGIRTRVSDVQYFQVVGQFKLGFSCILKYLSYFPYLDEENNGYVARELCRGLESDFHVTSLRDNDQEGLSYRLHYRETGGKRLLGYSPQPACSG